MTTTKRSSRSRTWRHQGFLRAYVEETEEGPVYTDRYGEVVDFEAWKATGGEWIVFDSFLRGPDDERCKP